MLRNRGNLHGRKVCVEGNEYGIIKFYGETSFAEGLWCGIELDEAVGDNNGVVENIRYFTCKENHGIFVPASETSMANTPVSENYSDVLSSVEPVSSTDNVSYNVNSPVGSNLKFSVLDDSQSVSTVQKNVLNESYTISKEYYDEKNLSIIMEENIENSGFQYFANVTNLSECESMFSIDQGSKPISATSENPENEISGQDFEIFYDSDESLGILPDLIKENDLEDWDSLIFDKNEPNRDLNITVNVSDKYMEKVSECLKNEPKFSGGELIISPICQKPNILYCAKSDESPVSCNQNTPMCASTPKHESNFSYVIDEVASTQNVSNNNFLLDKKFSENYTEKEKNEFIPEKENVTETGSDSIMIPTSTHSESSEDITIEQNLLNVTCNIFKPLDNDETTLNKTFGRLDVLTDENILPTVVGHIDPNLFDKLNTTDDHKEELKTAYSHFLPLIKSEQHAAVPFDSNVCKENVLNLTCDLVKESEANFPQIELPKDGTFSADPKSSTTNILNATLSYPQELDKTQEICFISENESENLNSGRNIVQCKTGDLLNTTYEKADESNKLDTDNGTLRCITNLEENRMHQDTVQLGTNNKSKKTQVKGKKGVRKNIGSLGRTNRTSAELNRSTQISSLASSSNKPLKLKLPKNTQEDKKSVSKIEFEGNQESFLNETINLPPLTSDVGKTVVKKPRHSVQFSYPKAGPVQCNIPLQKNNKAANLSFQKKESGKISTAKERKITPKSNETEPFPLSSKTVSKKRVALQEKKTISRLPQKSCPQTSSYSGIPSTNIKSSSTIPRSQSTASALKPPSASGSCEPPAARKPLSQGRGLVPKDSLNDTILISADQSSKKPSVKSSKPLSNRGIGIPSATRKPLNQRLQLVHKASLNDTIIISADQSSKEPSVESVKHSSIPQPSQQQVKKSSGGIPRRIGSSIPKPSRSNLR